jgi:hypothetical protein
MKTQLFVCALIPALSLSLSAQQSTPAAPPAAASAPASAPASAAAADTPPAPPKTLNNDSIIKLAKAGLSDDLIVTTINTSLGSYDTTTDGIIALKTAGVSDKVVAAILVKTAAPVAPAAPAAPVAAAEKAAPATPSLPTGVDTLGVYSQAADGSWQEFISSVVSMETGGAIKSFTARMVKGNFSGHVEGPTSRLKLTLPAKLLLYLPEGVSPGEYQLVRFRIEDGNRIFRLIAKNHDRATNGPIRDTVDFDARKIAPRLYEIDLGKDLGAGEYGLLPPAEAGAKETSASQGKIYAFTAAD